MKKNTVPVLVLIVLVGSTFFPVPRLIGERDWLVLFQTLLAMVALIIPFLMEVGGRLRVPPLTKILLMLFVYGAQYLGSVLRLYDDFSWWDKAMHFFSGPAAGLLGFSLALYFHRRPDGAAGMPRGLVTMFVFLWIMTIGALWEITEYAFDQLLGTDMQLGSLQDTMQDMLYNTLGAVAFLPLTRGRKARFTEALAIRVTPGGTVQDSGSIQTRPSR